MARRVRDERGVAFPSPLVMLSVVAVAMAGIAFLATGDDGSRSNQMQPVSKPSPTVTATVAPSPSATPAPTKQVPAVKRGDVYVEVYNNSGITGLAKQVAARASGAGWQVVGSDNWYGTIPASTVYYPKRLEAAGRLLARDLGISRVQPSVDPMRGDRLTVILTGDLR